MNLSPAASAAALDALTGLGFGLSLIVAIGAQNTFVLRQGLRREHVGAVVAVCMLSDVVLISAGVAGAGALLGAVPWLATVMRWGGAAFLLVYAALAARRALRPTGAALDADTGRVPAGLGSAVGTAMALTWLNPHVYLDTLVLLGSVAGGHGDGRWWFGAGAILGSVVWFTALGYGARLLRPLFARPRAWRVLDGAIAVVMTAIAVGLVAGA
ncbi:amino acid transporter [Xylanimonas oleitrophica]|uniref:Amino acid transporter n=1 Tax=Xylanimonas oleitrophica TaxID=2607479 RepID=A0A2W5WLP3_9MICO|nr:LysE/ArgO family amino acid transporter [Xylanimonas oleitrophica]PZR52237.1 amino acid transporter [Xylanimonas oleitrophica]